VLGTREPMWRVEAGPSVTLVAVPTVYWKGVGWPEPTREDVRLRGGRAGMYPHDNEDQDQLIVVRRRLAARSSANRPSCQAVR
jgi:hypothetical protein